MITHHTFLHNKVSIFPQHNNIKIKIHIKSRSQQTKLVLNVDFEWGKALVQLAPFHLRPTHSAGCWGRGAVWRQRAHTSLLWQFQQKCSLPQLLGQTSVLVLCLIVCLAVDWGSSELISHHSNHPESKVRELSSVRRNSGKKKPWQFLTWSVYCTTTQLVTPTQGWAGGRSRSWNPCEWGGRSSWWFGCHNGCFWHCVTFAACPASWGDC